MADPHDLQRFVDAQRDIYQDALVEILSGRKRNHWMWFIFPQVAGLGQSSTARFYAISSLGEARAYLTHPVLGPRYSTCVEALQGLAPTSPETVFGAIDAVKLRSSLTLFEAAGGPPVIGAALERWFDGERDPATLARL